MTLKEKCVTRIDGIKCPSYYWTSKLNTCNDYMVIDPTMNPWMNARSFQYEEINHRWSEKMSGERTNESIDRAVSVEINQPITLVLTSPRFEVGWVV